MSGPAGLRILYIPHNRQAPKKIDFRKDIEFELRSQRPLEQPIAREYDWKNLPLLQALGIEYHCIKVAFDWWDKDGEGGEGNINITKMTQVYKFPELSCQAILVKELPFVEKQTGTFVVFFQLYFSDCYHQIAMDYPIYVAAKVSKIQTAIENEDMLIDDASTQSAPDAAPAAAVPRLFAVWKKRESKLPKGFLGGILKEIQDVVAPEEIYDVDIAGLDYKVTVKGRYHTPREFVFDAEATNRQTGWGTSATHYNTPEEALKQLALKLNVNPPP